jgi:hypothetical protein
VWLKGSKPFPASFGLRVNQDFGLVSRCAIFRCSSPTLLHSRYSFCIPQISSRRPKASYFFQFIHLISLLLELPLPSKMAESESDIPEPQTEKPQFRTYQQQEKYENALAQQKRESGEQTNRSRSQSRRARRQRIKEGIESGKYMKTTSLEALEEADASGELSKMGMFERIGPDSTSMDGPVTQARAMRGEIPMRGTDPNQPYKMPAEAEKKGSLDDKDGLKLKIEANLDIEIELKASIRGDLTLSL